MEAVKLEDLLNADPKVIELTGMTKSAAPATEGTEKTTGKEIKQVQVLVPEESLIHRCAYCGSWESVMDRRWYKVGQEGDDGVYWCGVRPYFRLTLFMP